MKLSYWGMIKEKTFTGWMNSFDIDYKYKLQRTNIINNNVEYKLFNTDFGIDISWSISLKENDLEKGGCVTKISLYAWDGLCQTGFISFEKNGKFKIRKSTNLKLSENGYRPADVNEVEFNALTEKENGKEILEELDNFMIKINPNKSVKFLRDKKINSLFLLD